ncbi:hypothetical protein FKW77_009712 [Venturia effusa]|uniref:Alpha/beta-hydrolase n=1 Tax=Venturia effusa TaxID=50376 RepID=A0A517KXE1_9PEZI|nr:hypothetical protein FKW77_009712 [Venturia effusa]
MRCSSTLLLAASTNKVLAGDACSPLHFIYARATTEPAETAKIWSKGYGAAGTSIFSNVTKLIPEATGYPVHYPASFGASPCTSEDPGVADMLKQIETKAKACPDQKYVLGGHSQGGVVTVRTINKIPADLLPRILAVTMVGSPECPASVKDRCKSFCNQGDGICSTGKVYKSSCDSGSGGATKGAGSAPAAQAPKVPKSASSPKAGAPPKAEAPSGSEDKAAPKDMGGMDMSGMDMGGMDMRSVEISGTAQAAGFDLKSICEGPEPPEKGYKVTQSKKGAHMAYSEDGYYVYAAACLIQKKFKAATA